MKAYVILRTCERTKFETLLFDPDEVIEYLNKNQGSGITFEVKTFDVPKEKDNFVYTSHPQNDWPDSNKPAEIYPYTNDSVLNDTMKVTCTSPTPPDYHTTSTALGNIAKEPTDQ